jgi:glutathione peroxidase-family protein
MGNSNSSNGNMENPMDKFDNFDNVIDFIATYYILTMDFQSLKKLYEKDYCDKLVILTSGIIDRYFSDVQITYMAQRIKNGEEVNELAKENVMFLTKDQLDDLDVKNDRTKTVYQVGRRKKAASPNIKATYSKKLWF